MEDMTGVRGGTLFLLEEMTARNVPRVKDGHTDIENGICRISAGQSSLDLNHETRCMFLSP